MKPDGFQCTYRKSRHKYGVEGIGRVVGLVRSELEGGCSPREAVEKLKPLASRFFSCITDRFSLLRHVHYLLKKAGIGEIRPGRPSDYDGLPPAERTLLLGLEAVSRVREGGADALKFMFHLLPDPDDGAALLRGLADFRVSLPFEVLFAHLSVSVYGYPALRDIVRSSIRGWDRRAFGETAGPLILDERTSTEEKIFLLDLLSEHRVPGPDGEEIEALIGGLIGGRSGALLQRALFRYAGESGIPGTLDLLKAGLENRQNLEPVALCAVMDAAASLGDEKLIDPLRALASALSDNATGPSHGTAAQLAQLCARELEGKGHRPSGGDGAAIVQCMFHGDLLHPGRGEAGGLATFLRNLGSSLARSGGIGTVYTLALHPLTDQGGRGKLLNRIDRDHELLGIPVSFTGSRDSFFRGEYEIIYGIERTLSRVGINPDVFHLRYSDGASKAAAVAADRLGARVVFTLTPDPHRRMSGEAAAGRTGDGGKITAKLGRIYEADRIVDLSDGIVLIGHGARSGTVTYFPQLHGSRAALKGRLGVLSEGIEMHPAPADVPSIERVRDMLAGLNGTYRLDPSLLHRPVLLNVGRLDPVKGQHLLVEAWAESGLHKTYNLVLIGGGDGSSPQEREVTDRIDRVLAGRGELTGRFAHSPALPNKTVRMLELALTRVSIGDQPSVYVCSSFKEEFGIAVIEAMSAGLLVFAPERGGASSYIRNGKNGFLLDTTGADTMGRALEAVLMGGHYGPSVLRRKAHRGRRYAKRHFSIGRTSTRYVRFYRGVCRRGC